MATPAWLLDTFAAFMLVVAVVNAARLVLARRWQRGLAAVGIDVASLLMAVAMAAMLEPRLSFLPVAGWEVVFGLVTAWLAWQAWLGNRGNGPRALASGPCAPHLVHAGAMLYMFLALPAPAAGQGGAGMLQALAYPTVAFAFALALLGYSAWDLDRLPGMWHGLIGARARLAPAGLPSAVVPVSGWDGRALLLSPGMLVASRVTMGVTMALMLLIMI